jgi:hypothetical protein
MQSGRDVTRVFGDTKSQATGKTRSLSDRVSNTGRAATANGRRQQASGRGSSPRFDDALPVGRSVEHRANTDREPVPPARYEVGEVRRDSTTLRLSA